MFRKLHSRIAKPLAPHFFDPSHYYYSPPNPNHADAVRNVCLAIKTKRLQFSHSALYVAAQEGYPAVAAELIQMGAHIDKKALHVAIKNKHVDVVKMLIEHGAEIDDSLALMNVAIHNNDLEMAKILHQVGVRVCDNSQEPIQMLPLEIAARRANIRMMQFLLKAGANVNGNYGRYYINEKNDYCKMTDESPLREAIKSNRTAVALCLINHAAIINDGLTPTLIDIATTNQNWLVVESIKRAAPLAAKRPTI